MKVKAQLVQPGDTIVGVGPGAVSNVQCKGSTVLVSLQNGGTDTFMMRFAYDHEVEVRRA